MIVGGISVLVLQNWVKAPNLACGLLLTIYSILDMEPPHHFTLSAFFKMAALRPPRDHLFLKEFNNYDSQSVTKSSNLFQICPNVS